MTTTQAKASELLRLHTAPELLLLVNVWDVATARVVAAVPGTRALSCSRRWAGSCPPSTSR